MKIVGVVICFVGAITTGLADSSSGGGNDDDGPNHTVSGDIIALLGAAGYGLYTTTIRYLVPEDESEAEDRSAAAEDAPADSNQMRTTNNILQQNNSGVASSQSGVETDVASNNNSSSNRSGRSDGPKAVSMHLLLGYIGLVNAVILAPVLGVMVSSL